MFGEVHGEHVARTVICDTLIPPSNRLFRTSCPRIDVSGEGGIGTKAEVNGNIRIAFVDPQVLVRVQSIVKQVLQLVSED